MPPQPLRMNKSMPPCKLTILHQQNIWFCHKLFYTSIWQSQN